MKTKDVRPEDRIIDRYLLDLTPEEREETREQLMAFVDWQMRIIMRQISEEQAQAKSSSEGGN